MKCKQFLTKYHRADLIDQNIEQAVARMQSVIELGRYIRDVKVIPIKVPHFRNEL